MTLALKKIDAIETVESVLPFRSKLRLMKGGDIPVFTFVEYLEFERQTPERHEFVKGRIIKMAGESLAHSQLCFNLAVEFGQQLKNKNCQGLSPNMKVRTTTKSLFFYPDLTVICGAPMFHDTKKDVLTNPTVIFEVLSPSTERYDRGEKFQYYKNETPSLTDYVLVSQDQILVEKFTKQTNGTWLYRSFERTEDLLTIASIECEVLIEDIYLRVELPAVE